MEEIQHLPPAKDVSDAPYELRELEAPVLRGIGMGVFVRVFESWVGGYVYPVLARQSGVTQVLLGLKIPEHPLFGPDLSPVTPEPEPQAAELELHLPAAAIAAANLAPAAEGKGGGLVAGGGGGRDGAAAAAAAAISESLVAAVRRALQRGLLPHEQQLEAEGLKVAGLKAEGLKAEQLAGVEGPDATPVAGGPWAFSGGPTIVDYARAYRSGSLTPSQVAERIIEFVTAGQARRPPLGWFVGWDPVVVRQQAEESTRRYASGTPRSLLEGVPFAVKDVADAVPFRTTAGTVFVAEGRPVTSDAPFVATLRALGGMLLGKTSMHEIGLGITGLNPRQGATALNPHGLAASGGPAAGRGHCYFTGGSSSGTAAVLAAGLCPIAIGSDGGGSIRIPSSFCGLVGLKPSAGRVGGRGLVEVDCTVATMGPMAGCVQDAALLHAVMSIDGPLALEAAAKVLEAAAAPEAPPAAPADGPRQDVTSGPAGQQPLQQQQQQGQGQVQGVVEAAEGQLPALPCPWPTAPPPRELDGWRPLKGLRVGVYDKWFNHASPAVVSVCRAALTSLEACGAAVEAVVVPELEHLRVAHTVTILSEMLHNFRARYEDPRLRASFNLDVRLALSNARLWSPADYLQAQRIRARANVHFRRVLSKVHVIATPTTPLPAPRIHPGALSGGESNLRQVSRVMRFVVGPNMLGLPAISLPVGAVPPAEDQETVAVAVGAGSAVAAGNGSSSGGGGGGGSSVLLPVGLQLIGRPLQEATLLRVGAVLEAMTARKCGAGGAKGGAQGEGTAASGGGGCLLPATRLNPLTGERNGL